MQIIGRVDRIDLPEFGLTEVPAKIDTGANRSAIHCSEINHIVKNNTEEINFKIQLDPDHSGSVFHSQSFFKKKIRSSSGHLEERYIIKTTVVLFGKEYKTTFSLTDRSEMRYPVLLGRKLLRAKFLVDVSRENLSFNSKKNNRENSNIIEKP